MISYSATFQMAIQFKLYLTDPACIQSIPRVFCWFNLYIIILTIDSIWIGIIESNPRVHAQFNMHLINLHCNLLWHSIVPACDLFYLNLISSTRNWYCGPFSVCFNLHSIHAFCIKLVTHILRLDLFNLCFMMSFHISPCILFIPSVFGPFMISSSCIWLVYLVSCRVFYFQSLFNRCRLHLLNSQCIPQKQQMFDPILLCVS